MCQWLSTGNQVMGGTHTVVQRASDHCKVIKHRQAIFLEGIPPTDEGQNMRGKVQHIQNVRQCCLLLDTFRVVIRERYLGWIQIFIKQKQTGRRFSPLLKENSLPMVQNCLDWNFHNLHPYTGVNKALAGVKIVAI